MSLRPASLMIISLFFVALLAASALGISVSVSTGDGSGGATSSSSYSLDDSTSLKEEITLMDSNLQKSLQASGTGKNEIRQQMKGGLSSLQSSMRSQGSLDISSSGYASAGFADFRVGLSAQGDISLSGQASQGQAESGQEASVSYGAMASMQSLSAGQGVSASQSTEMAGLEGYVGMGAYTKERALVATGGFLGAGTMSASLSSESNGVANAVASVSVDGKQWLEDEDLMNVNENGMAMSLEGLREDETGNLGTFNMQAASMDRANYDADDAFLQDGAATSTILYLNNPSAYLLKGWKWTMQDPQINLILKNDAILAGKGLGADATKNAIAAAADTWDYAVAKNLFADGDALVTLDPDANVDTYDNKNVHAWASISGGLAYSRTYSYSGAVIESDVVYNSNANWATDGVNNYDVQAVAAHELGHTIGLGDLYGKPQFDSDRDEIMHYYAGPRHSLGPGDRNGAQALYGPSGPLYCMSAPYTTI